MPLFPIGLIPPSPAGFSPSPPSLAEFPWCRCNKNAYDTPFMVDAVQVTDTDTATEYELVFAESQCLGNSPCCDMDLWKIEFHVGGWKS
jgi:hypothetical protein